MTKLLVEEYAATLQKEAKSPNTINRILAAVRWWARRVADLAFEDMRLSREAREDIKDQAARGGTVANVRGTRGQKGRHLAAGELAALQACQADETPAGARDAAVIALGWATR